MSSLVKGQDQSMSQIGRKPIEIPEKVQINLKDNFITVTGPLGEMPWTFDNRISVKMEDFVILAVIFVCLA